MTAQKELKVTPEELEEFKKKIDKMKHSARASIAAMAILAQLGRNEKRLAPEVCSDIAVAAMHNFRRAVIMEAAEAFQSTVLEALTAKADVGFILTQFAIDAIDKAEEASKRLHNLTELLK